MNIKRAGHARLAFEVNDVSRQQQEPTVGILRFKTREDVKKRTSLSKIWHN